MPLNVTEHILKVMFNEYGIPADFSNVVASFGQVPHLAEARSNNAMIQIHDCNAGELSYQIRYVEMNKRKGPNPWSLRHTGVYHRLESKETFNIVVVLHPVGTPLFENIIAELQHDKPLRQRVCGTPLLLHEKLFACYFDQWRWYIRDLGDRFHKENDLAMVRKVDRAEPRETFERVQHLRNTNDLLLFARACCAGNHDLLDRLYNCVEDRTNVLAAQSSRMSGYIESADVLIGRCQNLIDLVGICRGL